MIVTSLKGSRVIRSSSNATDVASHIALIDCRQTDPAAFVVSYTVRFVATAASRLKRNTGMSGLISDAVFVEYNALYCGIKCFLKIRSVGLLSREDCSRCSSANVLSFCGEAVQFYAVLAFILSRCIELSILLLEPVEMQCCLPVPSKCCEFRSFALDVSFLSTSSHYFVFRLLSCYLYIACALLERTSCVRPSLFMNDFSFPLFKTNTISGMVMLYCEAFLWRNNFYSKSLNRILFIAFASSTFIDNCLSVCID